MDSHIFQQQQLLKQSNQQNVSALDTFFSSFSTPSDVVLAPDPDLFESELDDSLDSLANFDQLQLQLFAVDQLDPFSFLRSDTPVCGPPSTITASSESTSAYDSVSNHSESFYSSLGFPGLDLDMNYNNLRRIGTTASEYSDYASFAAPQAPSLSIDASATYLNNNIHNNGMANTNSYSTFSLPPTSPVMRSAGSVYSDYSASDYYPSIPSQHPSLRYNSTQSATVSPSTLLSPPRDTAPQQRQQQSRSSRVIMPQHSPISATLSLPFLTPLSSDARAQAISHAQQVRRSTVSTSPNSSVSSGGGGHASGDGESNGDPRRRYQCKQCPRAFARAYNLKTHAATHDPNRLKAYVCPHRSCGRSFSRKHDLGRHLVSIHRDDPGTASKTAADAAAAVTNMMTSSTLQGSGSSAIDTDGEGESDMQSEGQDLPKVGVAGMRDGTRNWCEVCGKSNAGKDRRGCECLSVK